jgi:hypothetical protein
MAMGSSNRAAPSPSSGVADTLEEANAEFKRRYAEVNGRT